LVRAGLAGGLALRAGDLCVRKAGFSTGSHPTNSPASRAARAHPPSPARPARHGQPSRSGTGAPDGGGARRPRRSRGASPHPAASRATERQRPAPDNHPQPRAKFSGQRAVASARRVFWVQGAGISRTGLPGPERIGVSFPRAGVVRRSGSWDPPKDRTLWLAGSLILAREESYPGPGCSSGSGGRRG